MSFHKTIYKPTGLICHSNLIHRTKHKKLPLNQPVLNDSMKCRSYENTKRCLKLSNKKLMESNVK